MRRAAMSSNPALGLEVVRQIVVSYRIFMLAANCIPAAFRKVIET
jgi:hypothetical protein